jgi:hypothetical protein
MSFYLIRKILQVSKESICSIVTSESVVIFKDFRWRIDQNKSYRSWKVTQLAVDNFFIWNHLSNKNYIWFLKFKIWIFQTTSMEKRPKKIVDLETLCNFVVDKFFIWNRLSEENYGWIFSHLKFKFFKWP